MLSTPTGSPSRQRPANDESGGPSPLSSGGSPSAPQLMPPPAPKKPKGKASVVLPKGKPPVVFSDAALAASARAATSLLVTPVQQASAVPVPTAVAAVSASAAEPAQQVSATPVVTVEATAAASNNTALQQPRPRSYATVAAGSTGGAALQSSKNVVAAAASSVVPEGEALVAPVAADASSIDAPQLGRPTDRPDTPTVAMSAPPVQPALNPLGVLASVAGAPAQPARAASAAEASRPPVGAILEASLTPVKATAVAATTPVTQDRNCLCVQLDGSREEKMLARTDMLFKAPEPTTLKVKSLVRLAFTDNAIEGTTRWEYGKVVKVHNGKELLDIDLDNGQNLRCTPTFDVGVSLVE